MLRTFRLKKRPVPNSIQSEISFNGTIDRTSCFLTHSLSLSLSRY
jgi:hypothetical protein